MHATEYYDAQKTGVVKSGRPGQITPTVNDKDACFRKWGNGVTFRFPKKTVYVYYSRCITVYRLQKRRIGLATNEPTENL
jgi:hypothetical protein